MFLAVQHSYLALFKGDRSKENKNARQTRVALTDALTEVAKAFNTGSAELLGLVQAETGDGADAGADAGAEAEAAAIVPELPLSEIEQKIALDVSNALVGGYGELSAHIAGVVANLSVKLTA